MLWLTMAIAPTAFADPIAEKSPQYGEITQTLTTLEAAQADPEAAGYTLESLNQKISDLRLQKLIMESTEDLGICKNATAATIGVYGYDPDTKNATPVLAYLGAGQTTDDDWACTGVYLPTDAVTTGLDLQGSAAIATIVDGTRLTISQDPITGAITFDAPLYGLLQAPDVTLPALTQADVALQPTTAPVD
ncbi:hypothetical protein [Spirulina sp. CCNP1310]|uniref:hypothetical protein n=1 Tax=Spirulina sp. CCNP1310 TaxID=3110249 RepID=UPI002B2180AE|nr:hypothetical protein [Spirulina sp. CCNP1310]